MFEVSVLMFDGAKSVTVSENCQQTRSSQLIARSYFHAIVAVIRKRMYVPLYSLAIDFNPNHSNLHEGDTARNWFIQIIESVIHTNRYEK